jgi:hypothetical protein
VTVILIYYIWNDKSPITFFSGQIDGFTGFQFTPWLTSKICNVIGIAKVTTTVTLLDKSSGNFCVCPQ